MKVPALNVNEPVAEIVASFPLAGAPDTVIPDAVISESSVRSREKVSPLVAELKL